VVPERQRGFIGAALLKAQFERSAYGCRLYCCWCAQDLAANRFWESMGFVALAFRTGSARKSRVHIFWQKRIRRGDETTPYWFPSQTGSGAIREDRLVLPIPPGTSWSEAKPLVLPGLSGVEGPGSENRQLEHKAAKVRAPKVKGPVISPTSIALGGLRFGPPPQAALAPVEKPMKEPRKKEKNDPRLVAAARELRDRWLEHANANPAALVANGKYDVTRQIADRRVGDVEVLPVLPAPLAS
jgi:hypothetical protein